MEIDILDFVEECRHLAKQALGKHVVIHCFRREEGHSYRETGNRLEYMTALLEVLNLEEGKIPDFTTLNKSFDRFKMLVWRALLSAR